MVSLSLMYLTLCHPNNIRAEKSTHTLCVFMTITEVIFQ